MKTSTTNGSTTSVKFGQTGKISKTIGYYVAFIAFGLSAAALGPTLSKLAEHTQADLSAISFLFTARSLGFLFGAFLGGRLYDRVPGHPLIAVVLLIMAGVAFLTPLMSLLVLLTLLVLIRGTAEGMLEVGGNTLLIWVYRHNVGPFMNGLHFFFGVGAFLSPIIIARAVLMSGGIIWGYWALALLMLPAVVWLLYLPSPTIRGTSQGDRAQQFKYLPVLVFSLLFLLYVGAEASFGGWIYTYVKALNLGAETTAAYLTSAFWGALTLGRFLAIPLSTRFEPRTILIVNFVGCLCSLSIILMWPASLTAIWLGTLGVGLSMASTFPMLLAFAERHIQISGKVNGWFFTGSGLGGMTVPWLIGQLFDSIGPRATMVTILVDVIIAGGSFTILTVYWTRKSPEF
jgi:fucose permease